MPLNEFGVDAHRQNTSDLSLAPRCNCRRSKCLKLYCNCFRSGNLCVLSRCGCVGCCNTERTPSVRAVAVLTALRRNRNAFRPKCRRIDVVDKPPKSNINVDARVSLQRQLPCSGVCKCVCRQKLLNLGLGQELKLTRETAVRSDARQKRNHVGGSMPTGCSSPLKRIRTANADSCGVVARTGMSILSVDDLQGRVTKARAGKLYNVLTHNLLESFGSHLLRTASQVRRLASDECSFEAATERSTPKVHQKTSVDGSASLPNATSTNFAKRLNVATDNSYNDSKGTNTTTMVQSSSPNSDVIANLEGRSSERKYHGTEKNLEDHAQSSLSLQSAVKILHGSVPEGECRNPLNATDVQAMNDISAGPQGASSTESPRTLRDDGLDMRVYSKIEEAVFKELSNLFKQIDALCNVDTLHEDSGCETT